MTYISDTLYEKARFFTTFRQMTSMEDSRSLLEGLIRIQTDRGMDADTAEANALRCVAAVAGRETLFAQFSEDTAAATDRLFELLARNEPHIRTEALRRILFGLTAHSDPDFDSTKDPEEQFRHWLRRQDSSLSPEALEDRIHQALQTFHISPGNMKVLARRLANTEGCLATALALSERGRNLKCLMTMDLWLDNQDTLSMEAAAHAACASADYQAMADAVAKGYITRDVAQKVLTVVAVVLLLAGVFYLTSSVDSLLIAIKGFAAEGATASVSAAASVASASPSFGSTLINYGNLFKPTPSQYLGWAATDGFWAFLSFKGSSFALSDKAANLAGAAGSWLAGLLHSGAEGAAAMDVLAGAMAEEAVCRETAQTLHPREDEASRPTVAFENDADHADESVPDFF